MSSTQGRLPTSWPGHSLLVIFHHGFLDVVIETSLDVVERVQHCALLFAMLAHAYRRFARWRRDHPVMSASGRLQADSLLIPDCVWSP